MELFLVAVLAVFFASADAFAQVTSRVSFAPEDVTFTQADEFVLPSLHNGIMPDQVPGYPAIPARFVNILLPEGTDFESVAFHTADTILLGEGITLWPAQVPSRPGTPPPPFVQPDPAAYSLDALTPDPVAEVVSVQTMRGRRLVMLRLNPLRYNPAAGQLWLVPEIEITVAHTAPLRRAADATPALTPRFRNMLNGMVVNPEKPRRDDPPEEPEIAYIIITSDALEDAFVELARHREGMFGAGKTLVMTVESILDDYEGRDAPEQIRNFIIEAVQEFGAEFIVLGGDDMVVPARFVEVSVGPRVESMPVDLYYSALEGDWDANENDVFGELEDDVDMAPDVIVGRIPVRTEEDVENYIAKLVAWEAGENADVHGKLFLSGTKAWHLIYGSDRGEDEVLDSHPGFRSHQPVSDVEHWVRRAHRDAIQPHWSASEIDMFFDTLTSWDEVFAGDFTQTPERFVEAYNRGFEHQYYYTHGHNTLYGLENHALFSRDEVAQITNTVAFITTVACLTAYYDGEEDPCLAEAFLRSPAGALLYHGCARYGWGMHYPDVYGGDSPAYAKAYLERVFDGSVDSFGAAYALGKTDFIAPSQEMGTIRWLQFGIHLLGDPAIAPRANSLPAMPILTSAVNTNLPEDGILVEWDDQATNAKGFELQRLSGEDEDWHIIAATPDGVTEYLDTELAPHSIYLYRVRATNEHGHSIWSNPGGLIYGVLPADEWDPADDTPEGATVLPRFTADFSLHGPHTLSSSDTNDWFTFEVQAGYNYHMTTAFEENFGGLYAHLYDAEMNLVAEDGDRYGFYQFAFFYSATNDGTMFLQIEPNDDRDSAYYYLLYRAEPDRSRADMLGAALDAPHLPWRTSTGVANPWFAQTDEYKFGGSAVQSGQIYRPHDTTSSFATYSWIETEFELPVEGGFMSFWFKADLEPDVQLRFRPRGDTVDITGQNDWAFFNRILRGGDESTIVTMRFELAAADFAQPHNSRFWLDRFQFTPGTDVGEVDFEHANEGSLQPGEIRYYYFETTAPGFLSLNIEGSANYTVLIYVDGEQVFTEEEGDPIRFFCANAEDDVVIAFHNTGDEPLDYEVAAHYTVRNTFYVDAANPTPQEPFDTWETAATTIQDAVDLAGDGDLVLVNDGIYNAGGAQLAGMDITHSRVVIRESIELRSVNGPELTIIEGREGDYSDPEAIIHAYRCLAIAMEAPHAEVKGFTLRGGFTYNGTPGHNASPTDPVGGGAVLLAGTIEDCIIEDNRAMMGGGVGFVPLGLEQEGYLYHSLVRDNIAEYAGGIFAWGDLTIERCTVFRNLAAVGRDGRGGRGGGAELLSFVKHQTGEIAVPTVRNSHFAANRSEAEDKGGGGIFMDGGHLINCTIVNNHARSPGGGIFFMSGDTNVFTIANSIIYYNRGSGGDNYYDTGDNLAFTHSCSTPYAPGLTTDEPLLVGLNDPHILPGSPMIAAGDPSFVESGDLDIDGEPRQDPDTHTVDIGCDQLDDDELEGPLEAFIYQDYQNTNINTPFPLYSGVEGKATEIVWTVQTNGGTYSVASAMHIEPSWSEPGTYEVTLTAVNYDGVASTTITVNVVTPFTNTIAQTSALIADLIEKENIPAMSIALVDGGQTVWSEGFGMANREEHIPADADTIFRIASMSKAFAAMSIMKLQEDDVLHLSDDVTATIPELSLLPRFPDQSLTIRSLLAHDSSIPGTYYRHAETTTQLTNYYTSVLETLAEDYFLYPPGFCAIYNNNAVTLVEGVVAGATGMDYRDYLTDHLLTPMDLADTVFKLDEFQHQRLARYYAGDTPMPDEYVNAFASGGLYSSVNDLARWMAFLLGNGTHEDITVLDPDSIAAMWTAQSDSVTLRFLDRYTDFGLGWDNVNDPQFDYVPGKACWKNGGAIGYGSFVLVLPEQQLGVVVLNSVSGDAHAQPVARFAMQQALEEARGKPAPEHPPILPTTPTRAWSTNELAEFSGRYATMSGYDTITVTPDGLIWKQNAHTDAPTIHAGLVPHEDGWFYAPDAQPSFQLGFTNAKDRIFLKERIIFNTWIETIVRGKQFTPTPPTAAWSNRADKTWIVANLEPESLYWINGAVMRMHLHIHDDVLMVSGFTGQSTLQPQSDDLAFPFAIGSADAFAIQARTTNGVKILRHGGFDYHAIEDLPALQAGTSATGTLEPGETALYHVNIHDPVYHNIHITPDLDHDLFALPDWTSAADLSQPGSYLLAIRAHSNVAYQARLYNLTNTITQATAMITNYLADRDISAFSVALVDGANTVWQDGFGLADRENNIAATCETIYNVGSVSKTFTAVAVMQLVDDGKLLLDEPLTNHFPELVLQPRFPDAPPMTARQLLSHLSGLPTEFENGMITLWPVASSDVPRVMAALPNEYPAMPPNFTPVYCNTGWTVAEALVEKLAGMSFTDYTREHIFLPLGMTNTAMQHDAFAMETPPARPYRDGKRLPFEYLAALGAGAATSTSADLARFLTMLLGAGTPHPAAPRVLQSESVREMFRPQATNTTLRLTGNTQYPFFSPGLGFDGTHSDQFAYLEDLTPNHLGRFACKGGDTLTQHAFITLLPDAQLAIALNISGQGVPLFVAADQILRYATLDKFGEYGPDELPDPPPSDIVPATADDLRALEGTYATADGYTLIAADTNNLTLTWIADAHTPEPDVQTGLVLRANGWFSSPTSQDVELLFTNVLDQACIIMRTTILVYRQEKLYAQRYTPAPLSPAWSNRVGGYVIANLAPGEYQANALDEQLSFELAITNGMLALINKEKGTLLYNPINEHTALLNFYGERSITSLRFDPEDDRFLHHADFLLQRLDTIPALTIPASTNGIVTADETILYRIPVTAGQTYTLDLTTTNTVQATLSHGDDIIARANTAHAFHIVPETDTEYVLAINRDGPYPGPWSLAIHANPIPFYHQLAPTDWPAKLTAHSNLFPNTDFGHVFVNGKRPGNADVPSASFPVLKIAVARMNSSAPDAQPLFFCNGGPEDSSILCVYQHYMSMFTDAYDVYLIDQRGINFSQPLLAAREGETLAQTQYRLAILQGADLPAINTTESSFDLEDVAAAFGLSDVNLLGQSYGTLLTQTLMRREPDWLRAVVLDGPVAPNIPAFEEGGLVMREALDALVRDVMASPTAATWYPELNEEFYSLATRLQEHPYTLVLPGWTNVIDGMTFIEAVNNQLTMGDLGTRERVPAVIWRAWRGEQAALAELYTGNHFDPATMIPNVISDLMGRLVIRHDFLPFTTLEGVTNAAAGLREPLRTYAIAYDTAIINSAAELDDYGQASPEFALPVTSAIPALVINGTYDTQTGTNWAVEVAAHLPNSFLVLVPTVGHGVLAGGACPQQIVRDFLADPTRAPDTSCIANMTLEFPSPWPGDVPPVALNQPVTSHFPTAQSSRWYAFDAHSNIIYDITTGPVALHLVDDHARTLHTATGSTAWHATQQGLVNLWLRSDQPATNILHIEFPLLMRGIAKTNNQLTLTWQSPDTNTPFTIEISEDLTNTPAFTNLVTNIPPSDLLNHHTVTNNPATPFRFYRITQ